MRRGANHPNTKRLKAFEDILKRYREGVAQDSHALLEDDNRVVLWEFVRQLTNELADVQREYEAAITANDVRRGKVEIGLIEDCVICAKQCRTRCPNLVKMVYRVDGLPFETGTDASRAVLVEEVMPCGFSCHRHPSCALMTKVFQRCTAIVKDRGIDALPEHFKHLWNSGAAGRSTMKNESWVCKMCVGSVQVAEGQEDATFPQPDLPYTEADTRVITPYRGRVGPWNGREDKEHVLDQETNKIVYLPGERLYSRVGEYYGRSEGRPAPIRPTNEFRHAQSVRATHLLVLEKQGQLQLDQELERELTEHGRNTGVVHPIAGVAVNPNPEQPPRAYPCRMWPTFGGCPKGSECPYAHDRELLPNSALCFNCGTWTRHTTLYCPRPGGSGVTAQHVEQIQAQQVRAQLAGT